MQDTKFLQLWSFAIRLAYWALGIITAIPLITSNSIAQDKELSGALAGGNDGSGAALKIPLFGHCLRLPSCKVL